MMVHNPGTAIKTFQAMSNTTNITISNMTRISNTISNTISIIDRLICNKLNPNKMTVFI